MPMLAPWSDHEQPDGSIQVRFNDQHRFTLNWVQERGQWELRRTGQDEVIETDQYRNDLFSAIQSGRIDLDPTFAINYSTWREGGPKAERTTTTRYWIKRFNVWCTQVSPGHGLVATGWSPLSTPAPQNPQLGCRLR